MTTNQAIGAVAVLSIIAYLGLLAELLLYFERRHRAAWLKLGAPIPWRLHHTWRITKFVFLGGALPFWSDIGLRLRLIIV